VLQLGTPGCSRAHDNCVIDGCAGPVMGDMAATAEGRVLGSPGCKIGDTNALGFISFRHFCRRATLRLTASEDPQ
jgi:hypothetical protein